jgi:hypothetical protein
MKSLLLIFTTSIWPLCTYHCTLRTLSKHNKTSGNCFDFGNFSRRTMNIQRYSYSFLLLTIIICNTSQYKSTEFCFGVLNWYLLYAKCLGRTKLWIAQGSLKKWVMLSNYYIVSYTWLSTCAWFWEITPFYIKPQSWNKSINTICTKCLIKFSLVWDQQRNDVGQFQHARQPQPVDSTSFSMKEGNMIFFSPCLCKCSVLFLTCNSPADVTIYKYFVVSKMSILWTIWGEGLSVLGNSP